MYSGCWFGEVAVFWSCCMRELQFEKLGSGRVVAWESCGLGELRFGEDLMWGS